VRLRPGGAWLFLGIPIREFTDHVIDLRSCLGDEVADLRESLGGAQMMTNVSSYWSAGCFNARVAALARHLPSIVR
jgi:hypothetical protein